jgi:hypothetical protein
VSHNLPTSPERRHSIADVLALSTGSAGSPTTGASPPTTRCAGSVTSPASTTAGSPETTADHRQGATPWLLLGD